ncbi:MAG: tyrosine-type recombinase/integrase [gamma proteobacterium symbiont of Lucinoma myriamae]|nr:tyrosine-type recombinase/integrase [gamma proteobacterium symbiont of Lucinoma myriamae]
MKVEPIRNLAVIQRIKRNLSDNLRDICLFTLGINTAFRANDLLSIKIGDVRYLQLGDSIEIKEKKTRKHRIVTLNASCINSLQKYLNIKMDQDDSEYLFTGQRGVLNVCTLNRMVKKWCVNAGLKGNYGSHSLRKTWGYHQRVTFNSDIPCLMLAYNHASQRQTLDYLGIQSEEIKAIYMNEI